MTPEEIERAERIRLYKRYVADGEPALDAMGHVFSTLALRATAIRKAEDFAIQRVRLAVVQAQCMVFSVMASEALVDESVRGAELAREKVLRVAALAEYTASLANGVNSMPAARDGWIWPVRVMESGWPCGSCEDLATGQRTETPHYLPPEFMPQVARSVNGARFRRRHPESGDGYDEPGLVAGWLSDGRVEGSAVFATVHLLKSAVDVRSTLMAARAAKKLDLFGVSVFAYISYRRTQIDGRSVLVAFALDKLVGVDLCAEPGAGGRFVEGPDSGRDASATISAPALKN